jgi:hypothetical protein
MVDGADVSDAAPLTMIFMIAPPIQADGGEDGPQGAAKLSNGLKFSLGFCPNMSASAASLREKAGAPA